MKHFGRQPSRAERWLAILLALIAVLVLAGFSSALWLFGQSRVVAGVIIGLFILSACLLYRSVRTAPRALSSRETSAVAWVLLSFGAAGAVFAALSPGGVHRLMLLGSGLSLLAAGLGGIRASKT